ncbi:conserved hypothetical protein [Alkaliphilus metalliredigens QYMF]|uniref:FlgN family protein n=1 Tax=Alkaliphilus metalliredigens (strain QYMF) TaxID=293826 RepID=A6TLE4_ALKMQ|nr:flagellar protein FlgN [Alkaliphilus metalliredigens]ABR47012.1 conserved hypothetical protein [Alkaliphilus metalliredigens QYMF]
MNEEIVSYLIRLSEGKMVLIQRLFDLTDEQQRTLKEEEMDKLNDLIFQKKEIMDKIDVLDLEFINKLENLKKSLGIQSLSDVQEEPVAGFKVLKSKIQQVYLMMEKIQQLDKGNQQLMELNLTKVKKELKNIKVGKKATKEYGKGYGKDSMEPPSIFIDKKK